MSNLDQFIAAVKTGGMARTNRFSVMLSPPPEVTSIVGDSLQDILLFCDSVQLPGLNLATTQSRTFGEFREVPYEKLYGDIQMNFYVDTNMYVKYMFDSWMNVIQNPNSRTFEYYNNYITDMTIYVDDVADNTRFVVNAYECYPKTISPIQMDYSSKDVMKLQVTMQYKYWRSSPASEVSEGGYGVEDFEDILVDQLVPESYRNDFKQFQQAVNEPFDIGNPMGDLSAFGNGW